MVGCRLTRRCSASRRASRRPELRLRRAAQLGVAVARCCQTRPIAAAISASLAPPRTSARRSWPRLANRQRKSLPSVDRRARLQSLQNAWVTLEIVPISPATPARHSASAPPSRRGAVAGSGAQRELLGDALDHFGRGQHLVHAPAVGRADVHVLDEAQRDVAAAEVARHRQDLCVVGAALDDHVDLDRAEAGALGGVDAAQHVGDREVGVVHAPEDASSIASRLTVTRPSPAAFSAAALRSRIEPLVVSVRSSARRRRRELGQHRDQPLEVAAQQRLAAGEADLLHAVGDEQAGQRERSPRRSAATTAAGRCSRGRTPPSACSSCSGNCSGR